MKTNKMNAPKWVMFLKNITMLCSVTLYSRLK